MQTTQQSPKKAYTAPRLVVHGSVEQLTQGEGLRGSDDMLVFSFGRISVPIGSYGTKRSS